MQSLPCLNKVIWFSRRALIDIQCAERYTELSHMYMYVCMYTQYSDSVNFQVMTITQRDQHERDHPVTRDSQSPM